MSKGPVPHEENDNVRTYTRAGRIYLYFMKGNKDNFIIASAAMS
jgi:hypothetical protein